MGETVELEISDPHSMMLEEIEASRTGVSDDLARQVEQIIHHTHQQIRSQSESQPVSEPPAVNQ